MGRIEKTVFISYRRTDEAWALAVFGDLTHHGYDVFVDYEGISSGNFETIVLENIKARAHFLVLLTLTALERCGDPKDWMRREIEAALDCQRNIVPLILEGFDFGAPAIASQLTGKLAVLKQYNGLPIPKGFFSQAMERLRNRFLSVPLDAVLHPASLPARQAATVAAFTIRENIKQSVVRPYLSAVTQHFMKYNDFRGFVPLETQPGSREPIGSVLSSFQGLFRGNGEAPSPAIEPDPIRAPCSIERFLTINTRVLLFGPPGSGKSALLRHLFFLFAKFWLAGLEHESHDVALDGDWQGRIPVFAEFKNWDNAETDVLSFLADQIRTLGPPEVVELLDHLPRLIEQGSIVLLLDGLDELPGWKRGRTRKTNALSDPRLLALERFVETHHLAKIGCVLSCRTSDFDFGLLWRDLHLRPLSHPRITQFALRFYETQGVLNGEALVAQIDHELDQDKSAPTGGLRELISEPFYLVMFLAYFHYQRHLNLPENTAKLLDAAVLFLTDRVRRDLRRGKNELAEVRKALAFLAYNMIDMADVQNTPGATGRNSVERELALAWMSGPRDDFFDPESNWNRQDGFWRLRSAPQLTATKNAQKYMRLAQRAALLDVTGDQVQFRHELLLQYFSAKYCQVAGSSQITPAVVNYGKYARFDTVWALWSGLDKTLTDRLLELLTTTRFADPKHIHDGAALALAAIGDRRAVPILVDDLAPWWDHNLRSSVAAFALGRLRDTRGVNPLLGVVNGERPVELRAQAVRALGKIGDDLAIQPLVDLLRNRNLEIELRLPAAHSLGTMRAPQAVEVLIESLSEGYYATVVALVEIGQPAVSPLLTALSGLHGIALVGAILALGFLGDVRALADLERLECSDEVIRKAQTPQGSVKNLAKWAIDAIRTAVQRDG